MTADKCDDISSYLRHNACDVFSVITIISFRLYSACLGTSSFSVFIVLFHSLEGVSQNIQEQQKQVEQLDVRVTDTEDKVEQLSTDVQDNKNDISKVKQDVTRQGEQLEELTEVVGETVEKVDELDHKVRSP